MSLKVIFLDFDGVLNSSEFFESLRHEETEEGALDPEALARLNRLVEATGAVIVVSSSWRHGRSPHMLQELLGKRGFAGVVHGKTRDWISENCTQRGDEIADWLHDHPECTSYVVLDDDSDMDAVRARFIQTGMHAGGLQDQHVDQAIEMLGEVPEREISVEESRFRTHQQRLLTELREHFAQGRRKVLLAVPTGGGRSAVAAEVCRQHVEAETGRVLWVCHRPALVEQARKTLERAGVTPGRGDAARAEVTLLGSLLRASPAEALQATLIVVEDVREIPGDRWAKLVAMYEGALFIGLTSVDGEGAPLRYGYAFDGVVGVSVADLIALHEREPSMGLVPCDTMRPWYADLEAWLAKKEIAQQPVEAYKAHGDGQRAVVFAPNVQEALRFSADFNAAGIPSAVLCGATPVEERHAVLERFRQGELQVICKTAILWDDAVEPCAAVCILACACEREDLYHRVVRSVMLPFPGKKRALLIDLRGASYIHGLPGHGSLPPDHVPTTNPVNP